MHETADQQESLEAALKDEILRMYQEVADHPESEFHFFHGREAAELFGYPSDWLDRAPPGAVASCAGVGNTLERAGLQPGETVLDLGSGAGLDAILASWQVGPTGRVIGVDLNPAMCPQGGSARRRHRLHHGVPVRTHGAHPGRRRPSRASDRRSCRASGSARPPRRAPPRPTGPRP